MMTRRQNNFNVRHVEEFFRKMVLVVWKNMLKMHSKKIVEVDSPKHCSKKKIVIDEQP